MGGMVAAIRNHMTRRLSVPTRPTATLALLALLGAACVGPDKPDGAVWTPGKADGSFEIRDLGPLPEAGSRIEVAGFVPSYRVESFGGAALEIDLRSVDGADPYLVVEGPLADQGDGVVPGAGPVAARDDDGGDDLDARLAIILTEPGVYRVIAGTYDSLGLGQAPTGDTVTLTARCTAGCYRPEMSARDFLTLLRDSGKLDTVADLVEAQLADLIPDQALRGQLVTQLRDLVASSDFAGVDRFPTVPLAAIGELRPALGLIGGEPPEGDEVVSGELMSLLGPCTTERKLPPPVHPALPEVGNGHFPDRTLSACQVSHSVRLAQILTSLAANNGSAVRYHDQVIQSPEALFDALMASGHTIEVRNERTYANFISLTLGETNVRWPVWLDTGVELAAGDSIAVPMGHSHHAWRIRGPEVDARVMFYLGISGAAFFAQTQIRPAWTGVTERDLASSATGDRDLILSTVEYAGRYLRRIRVERAGVAAGMPADGYGYLGVCNDSNAVIELATRGTITAFPLLRAAALDDQPLGDELDDLLRALPHDADGIADPRDAMGRILAMSPHPLDSPLIWDEGLRDQLERARAERGE